ncbi:MAG: hypothetical protein M3540_06170 [Actinomycetota bacterium]|nr:hypothetical protein [Actinomycetota bacterium]
MARSHSLPVLALALALAALAGASFSAALFSVELPPNIVPFGGHEFLGRLTSLDWSADFRLLLAAAGFGIAAAAVVLLARRRA